MRRRTSRRDCLKRTLHGSAIGGACTKLARAAPQRAISDRTAVPFRHCQTRQLADREEAEFPVLMADAELPPINAAHCVSHDQHLFPGRTGYSQPSKIPTVTISAPSSFANS